MYKTMIIMLAAGGAGFLAGTLIVEGTYLYWTKQRPKVDSHSENKSRKRPSRFERSTDTAPEQVALYYQNSFRGR